MYYIEYVVHSQINGNYHDDPALYGNMLNVMTYDIVTQCEARNFVCYPGSLVPIIRRRLLISFRFVGIRYKPINLHVPNV